jgi:hypothetical protein
MVEAFARNVIHDDLNYGTPGYGVFAGAAEVASGCGARL